MTKARLATAVAGLALLLVLGWVGLWHWSAAALEDALAQWRLQQRERGIAVDYQGPEIGGFPTALSARFGAPQAASARGWRWSGPEVSGAARVWAPFTIETRFPGTHRIVLVPRPGAAELEFEAEAAAADARATLRSNGTLERADLRASELTIRPLGQAPTAMTLLSGRFAPAEASGEGDLPRFDLMLEAAEVTLPDRPRLPLGQRIEEAGLDALLIGEIPPGAPEAALAQWRDAGGQLEVRRLALVWGPMTLEAEGNASLDRELRPIGAFTARIRGLLETLDALARDGAIPSGQVLAVRIAVMALGGTVGDGEDADIELPITLQGGRLFLGPVPLFRISPVL